MHSNAMYSSHMHLAPLPCVDMHLHSMIACAYVWIDTRLDEYAHVQPAQGLEEAQCGD